jgi:glucosamine--fructose-6-phosphate aminotransferase (isomerizing)
MCGIYGLILRSDSQKKHPFIRKSLLELARESESRGKDSSGFALRDPLTKQIRVIKGDIAATQLVSQPSFVDMLSHGLDAYKKGMGFCGFGHARLVTNGTQLHAENNQPVIKDNIVMIHNGIIVNHDAIWEKFPQIKREYTIDTEVIPALLRHFLDQGFSLSTSMKRTAAELQGTFSIAALLADQNKFLFATNNGSFYYLTDHQQFFVFASEESHLKKQLHANRWGSVANDLTIQHLQSGTGITLDLDEMKSTLFTLDPEEKTDALDSHCTSFEIRLDTIENTSNRKDVVIDPAKFINRKKEQSLFQLLENNQEKIASLKRCTKCILPETFPFISFDTAGICNYCRNYIVKDRRSKEAAFLEFLNSQKRKDGKMDCIVPFSGGRDSTYAMHYLVNVAGMRPLAYTYDWGMVTDLARRNIARVCGKHGIEHVIVAADIWKKRAYIRKNIIAWLKRPELGMIPLFMSGDKSFHFYLRKLQKQTGIDLNIWGENYLEKTDFKTGFGGVKPEFDKKTIYSLSLSNSLQLACYLSASMIKNPAYINDSLFDNLKAQFSRFFQKKVAYYNFYDFHVWDEKTIVDTIVSEYDWEFAVDTDSSWRIGDGTSAFYNYIYQTVAGFSENDTFRSNQIREGMITREQALALVNKENNPRYETLRWYLEIVDLDFTEVITKINAIPKLYH